jgi:GntR family transcriptional regulator
MAKTGTGKFAPVVEALRERIGTGELQPGDFLPSEAQLMDQFDVSRYSAREAIRRLASDGLIQVVDGKGSYVRTPQRASHADPRAIVYHPTGSGKTTAITRAYTDAEASSWTDVEQPTTTRVNANVDLALALGVPEHTPLFVYERLLHQTTATGVSGRDARRMTHRLYLPMPTCMRVPALADNPWRTPDQLYAALTDAGIDLAWTEHVRAALPAPDDTTSLHLPPGTAVLITRRITNDSNDPTGRPLAMEETRRNAENTQLTYPLIPIPANAGMSIAMSSES